MASQEPRPAESGPETVRRVAELARLDVTDAEAAALGAQFARILEQFRVLEKLDVSGVDPMVGASLAGDVRRADEPVPSLPAEALLANAPRRIGDFYGVPRTVGGEEAG